MAKTTTEIDLDFVEADARFGEPLARVAYAEGMMLGLEDTRDEQAYHRGRLVRHQFWLHGAGTVAGLPVTLRYRAPNPPDANAHIAIGVVVGPGVAIDGLGRETVLPQRNCVSLNDWLAERDAATLARGVRGTVLYLRVTARCRPCPEALQPVMARELSNVTDAVAPHRFSDECLLELSLDEAAAGSPAAAAATPAPWWRPELSDTDIRARLDPAETQMIAGANGSDVARLQAAARRVHAFATALPGPPPHEDDPDARAATLADWVEHARVLLARLEIDIGAGALPAAAIVNPAHIRVNNLVRSFVGDLP